eukprot:scaffold206175_cov31-Attheya_sp.AAC.1
MLLQNFELTALAGLRSSLFAGQLVSKYCRARAVTQNNSKGTFFVSGPTLLDDFAVQFVSALLIHS